MSTNTNNIGTLTGLSLTEAAKKAPAIMAEKPANYINLNRYKFTPTTEVINHMEDLGYVLTNAKQSATKVPLRRDFGTHIVEFQHPKLFIKDQEGGVEARPTIVLLNSHDGSRPIQFEMGIFRLVCSNGLMVKSMDLGSFRERHTKYTFQEVKNLIDSKVDLLPKVVEKINHWNGRLMTPKEQAQFAIDALLMRMGDDRQPENYEIQSILNPRRDADRGNSLWKTYNIVQENLIKGGFDLNNRVARGITNPVQDMVLNQGLWQLAEQYA
jgi:hypothetical protein